MKILQSLFRSGNGKRKRKAEKMYGRYRKAFRGVPEMEAGRALELYAENRVVFVDVRDPDEQAVSMLPAALTGAQFLATAHEHGEKTVLCYCTIGYRSGLFVDRHGTGFPNLHNLCGGLLLWLHAGGRVFRDGSEIRQAHVYGPKWSLLPEGYQPVFRRT